MVVHVELWDNFKGHGQSVIHHIQGHKIKNIPFWLIVKLREPVLAVGRKENLNW